MTPTLSSQPTTDNRRAVCAASAPATRGKSLFVFVHVDDVRRVRHLFGRQGLKYELDALANEDQF